MNNPPYFDVNTNHPIINNSQNYNVFSKYVSINSQDRDITKYPNASAFEIEFPQDYLNVYEISVYYWSFPGNMDPFTSTNNNTFIRFKITEPYNPGANGLSDPLQQAIFTALFYNNDYYNVFIDRGVYNYSQMTTELTNKFNAVVSEYIIQYFQENGYSNLINDFIAGGRYNQFKVVYNLVKRNIWIGNRSGGFSINNPGKTDNPEPKDCIFSFGNTLPNEQSTVGLFGYLGFMGTDQSSTVNDMNNTRFYYGDVVAGDNGYWLTSDPGLPGCSSNFMEAPNKLNLIGNDYYYMELAGYNCIDETSPYNLSTFTKETNQTNGIVDSSIIKIFIPSNLNNTESVVNFSDKNYSNLFPYKYFNPPAERIRKMAIKVRYHDGTLVDFGNFTWSITLKLTLLTPQINRKFTRVF